MAEHSNIIGGSTAGRLLECPGSWRATTALPAQAFVTSEYAEEGTALHEVMKALMTLRRADTSSTIAKLKQQARDWADGRRIFHDRSLLPAHLEAIDIALDNLTALERKFGDGFAVAGIEQQVKFPGIPGAFGTCDLFLRSEGWMLTIDWKFGAGVPVSAVYGEVDADGAKVERVNPQLLFYVTAAKATLPRLFHHRDIAVAIIQPRAAGDTFTYTTLSRKELDWFREDVEEAIVAALESEPPRKKGEWCRFAPCKTTCPLWTGPLLDLSAIGIVPQQPQDVTSELPTPYGVYLARAKALVDQMALFKGEIDDQMHAFLDQGGIIPGWRLKAKTKRRAWIDAPTVAKALRKLGFGISEIYQERPLVTFASADATARRLGKDIPEHLRVAPATSETTICTTDDPAPPIDRKVMQDQFRTALKSVLEESARAAGAAITNQQQQDPGHHG